MYNSDERCDILDLENAQEQKIRRYRQEHLRQYKYKRIEEHGVCEGFEGPCPETEGVEWRSSLTRYVWDQDKHPLDDPNRRLFMCKNCAGGYYDHWNEMWREYYAGLL